MKMIHVLNCLNEDKETWFVLINLVCMLDVLKLQPAMELIDCNDYCANMSALLLMLRGG